MENYYLDWSELTKRVYITNGKKKKDVTEWFDKIVAERQVKNLNIPDVMAMLPSDEKLEDILMDGYEMNEKNKERMKVGKCVRDKCAEMLVGN